MKIPRDRENATLAIGRRRVTLTNLRKLFFPEIGATKADLLQYYADVAPTLLPHLADRAMVMKRYPQGATGAFFFMKRTPSPHPDWLETCTFEHGSGTITFPMVNDLAALLWIVNLGCIDLNPWYARCDDVERPDYVHFDLDPGSAPFATVRDVALVIRDGLEGIGMPCYPKTSGSQGIHIYVPIKRGPTQRAVWEFAKAFAQALATSEPDLVTIEYRKERRPPGRVLVDYNQNRSGATLASVYSVRPTPCASVSAPVTWDELERGLEIEDFTMATMPARIAQRGDIWKPVSAARGRYDLARLLGG